MARISSSFSFYHWRDKDRVLGGQPWHFDRVALLLTDMDKAEKPSDLQFFALPIWARVYDVPFQGRSNEVNIRILGEKIGAYIDFDRTECLGMEKSLRIRVAIDVRYPLKKHVTIKLRGGEMCVCPVKYEKLPMVCFYCGKLGHGTNECKDTFGVDSPIKHYGAWMKASPWRPMRTEENKEKGGGKGMMGKRLFFTKKLPKEDNGDCPKQDLSTVTSLFDKVSISSGDLEEGVDNGDTGVEVVGDVRGYDYLFRDLGHAHDDEARDMIGRSWED